MFILSGLHLNALSIPKDAAEAEFINYLGDKAFVFSNLIMAGLLLVGVHGCRRCWARGFKVRRGAIVVWSLFRLFSW